ncbi:MAG TPA: type II toxin-antitoxin system RelE/ParE family toxin [Rhizomicrobium sp.]
MTKRRAVFSPAAHSDLDEIWDYTAQYWSADQANRYILDLVDDIESIAAGRRDGRSCDEIRPGYFKAPSGSHVVFYKLRIL